MRFPSASSFAIGGNALLVAALLFAATALRARAQSTNTQTRGPSAVRPAPPARPVARPTVRPAIPPPVAPIRPITVGHAQPPAGAPLPTARYGAPAIRAIRPITGIPSGAPGTIPSANAPGLPIRAQKIPGILLPGEPVGTVRAPFPPPTRRLLPSAPPKTWNVSIPTVTQLKSVRPLLPHFSGIAKIPTTNDKLYCSPDSLLYNTGSICFNPDIETINPQYYPWGLYAPPPVLTAHGFSSIFPIGLLIQPCPQCAFAAAGLIPSRSPLDRWRYLTSGEALLPFADRIGLAGERAVPAPPPAKPAGSVQASGPAVVLVLRSGTRVLVSRYWLGQDWLLHFITVTGSRRAVGLNQLNLKATGAANYDRGVVFVLPGWPEPRNKD